MVQLTLKKINSFLPKNQQETSEYNNVPQLFSLISKLTRFQRRLLNQLISFANVYHQVDPSQARLALYGGGSRSHCNVILKWFHELGFFKKIYRHRRTCIYILSDVFNYAPIRKTLSQLLPALKRTTIQVALLTALITKNLTPYKGDIYNNNKYKKESRMWPPKRPQEEPEQVEKSPPESIQERKVKALERELRYVRAERALVNIPKDTHLDDKGKEYLKKNPELQEFFAKMISLQ